MDDKEKIRKDLLERYISTGKVGLIKPKDDSEAIDLIETVVEMYSDEPVKVSLADMSNQFKHLLDF